MKNRWTKNTMALFTAILCVALFSATITAQASERVTYMHNDALGSTVAATDDYGQVLWSEEYSPYGKRELKESKGDNTIWYTGKPELSEVGLQYFGARWYDADLGIFVSQDPVGFVHTNPFSFNKYAYANNNPYKYIDPDGNSPVAIGRITYSVGRATVTPAINAGIRIASNGRYLSLGDAIFGLFNESNEQSNEQSSGGSGSGGGTGSSDPNNDKNKKVDPNTPKQTKPGQSGKEAAKDAPSWAKGERPTQSENGEKFANRLLNNKYGEKKWKKGPKSEFNKIKKWGDRAFK